MIEKVEEIQKLTEREKYIISQMGSIMYINNWAGHEIVDAFFNDPKIRNLLERNLNPLTLKSIEEEADERN